MYEPPPSLGTKPPREALTPRATWKKRESRAVTGLSLYGENALIVLLVVRAYFSPAIPHG